MGKENDSGGSTARFRPILVWAFLGLAALPAAAPADTAWVYSATQGPGDWFDNSHWSAQVPAATTNALIDNGGTALIASGSAAANNLTVGQTIASSTNTLSMTGGALTLTHDLMIGDQACAAGTVVLSAASLLGHRITVGNDASQATLTLQNGSASTNDFLLFGAGTNGTGTVNVWDAGSTIRTLLLTVGDIGNGRLDIAGGGGITNTADATLGNFATGVGVAHLAGAGSTWACGGALQVGFQGAGTIDITSGASLTNPNFEVDLGKQTNASGSVHVTGSGSAWTSRWDLFVGYKGSGVLSITNGGAATNTWRVHLGYCASSTGTVSVADPGSQWTTTGSLFVGEGGAGQLTITSGGQVASRYVSVGDLAGGTGLVTVAGTGSLWSTSLELRVGNAGSGGLSVAGGGQVVCTGGNAFLGYAPGSSAAVDLSDANSTWTVAGALYVGGSDTNAGGSATLTVGAGAAVNVTNGITLWTPGTLTLQGGQINTSLVQLNGGTIQGWGTLAPPLNVGAAGGAFNASDTSNALILNGAVTSTAAAGLTKTGLGTLIINAPQTHEAGASFLAAAGLTQMNSDAGGPAGATPNLAVQTASAGGPATLLAFGVSQHLHALTIGTNTVVSLDTNGGRVIVTDSLTMQGSGSNTPGTLNLHDNDLIVTPGVAGNANLLAIRAAIKAARDGGAWDRPGITTDLSSSNANPGLGRTKALGYAAGNDPTVAGNFPNGSGGTLDGQTYGPLAVIVKYTYAADANLDGSVDGVDISVWAQNFTGTLGLSPTADPAKVWTQGDWNFDGSVDGADASIWAQNFTGTLGGGGLSGLIIDAPGANPGAVAMLKGMGATVVPEPASLGLLALGGLMCLGRERGPHSWPRNG